MDKYELLAERLEKALLTLGFIKPANKREEEFLMKYRNYVAVAKEKTLNKSIPPSNGAMMGLLRWLSDYSGLEKNNDLWNIIDEIEDYYIKNF